MSKRKRDFGFDLPDDELTIDTPPAAKETPNRRRGPMATAVAETASSAQARANIEQSIREENDALAHEFVRLQKLGLIVDLIPVSEILTTKLTRDRAAADDADLGELKASIKEIGLSNPIRVEEGVDGGFELIQGYRRLIAFRELHVENPTSGFDKIPAGIMPKGIALEESYRRMVDENLVRKDISFAEMGELARAFAHDPATTCTNPDDAVALLFKSAGYQKRTYIRSFARLLDLLGDKLNYAPSVSRNLGLAVLKRLEDAPESQAELVAALKECADEASELGALSSYAAGLSSQKPPKPNTTPKAPRGKSKTTFRIEAAGQEVKCIAGTQRLEMSGGADFSAFERERLERAVRAFFDALNGD